MLEEISTRREAHGRRHDRHGFVTASTLLDREGEQVAMSWLREHEALPWHSGSECPMSGKDE